MRIIADERVAQLASFDFQLNFTVDECFALTFSSLPIFNHPLSLSVPLSTAKLDYICARCTPQKMTLGRDFERSSARELGAIFRR